MKRPDQYRIEEREGGASGYKNRSKHPEDGDRQSELYGRVMKGSEANRQPIPPATPASDGEEEEEPTADAELLDEATERGGGPQVAGPQEPGQEEGTNEERNA